MAVETTLFTRALQGIDIWQQSKNLLKEPLITEVRDALNQGLVLGSDQFKADVAAMTARQVILLKRGPKLKHNANG